jgi:hypothetical protein
MASAELLKVTHTIDSKVMDIRQEVNQVMDIKDRDVHVGIGVHDGNVQVGMGVPNIDTQSGHVNCSLSL